MSKRTRKMGSAGRFGARYGSTMRKRWLEIENFRKSTYLCPKCHHLSVHRVGTGIWECKRCGFKFIGDSYSPEINKDFKRVNLENV